MIPFLSAGKAGKNHLLSVILLSLFVLSLFSSCRERSARIGIVAYDLRSLAARLALELGIYQNEGLKVELLEFQNSEQVLSAIRSGKIEAAYVDARDALAQSARGEIDLKILAIANRSNYAPDVMLVVKRDWAEKNAKLPAALIEAHKKATRMILDEQPAAIEAAARWAGMSKDDAKKALSAIHFESGMDRAALIGLLDNLRSAKAISPAQAESMASRLVQEEAESSVPK